MRFKHALMAGVLLAAGPALAQEDAEAGDAADAAAPPAPCQDEIYRAFDFWLGDWTVTAPGGQLAGTNSITSEEDGCLIVERWSGAQGSTGQSYNFYDPGMKKWRQLWVSPTVVIDYSGGLNQRGHMVLEGTIAYDSGQTFPFRGEWTPNDDGSVRQHFEQFNPETSEWDEWFTGIYRK